MVSKLLGGRYAVQDKVGAGGMATVYRGLDQVLGRTVAVKTMLPQYANDASFAARFKQEAQAAAALQSPYIVSVYDWGKDDETYYIVMEYLRGTDLKSGIRKHGALDCKKVAQIGSQIAQALSVAHKHDIIHRDIKPQNIMVQPDGNVKVMDFGIARAKNSHLTADNSVLGTAHYVSPEQTQGKDLGPTTDIYSLGVVMYEAATGKVPFQGDDAISVALKQVNEQPKPPSELNPNVDAALESIILKCMQKNPADRFQSANELYRTLRDYLAGRTQAVSAATSVIPAQGATSVLEGVRPVPTTTANQTQTLPHNPQNFSRVRQQTATAVAAEQERKRKRRRGLRTFFGVIFGIALLAAGAYFALSLLGSRNQTYEVPNLLGKSEADALSIIAQNGHFHIGGVKSSYSDSVEEGLVMDQDPSAGRQFNEGTEINLVISRGPTPAVTVTVPDLSNKTPSEVEQELTRVGLIGSNGDSVFSDIEVGRVAQQSPSAGAQVKAGETVTYHLSKGTEKVTVPLVIEYFEATAREMLAEQNLEVSVTYSTSQSIAEGCVISQTPQQGSSVDKGTVVQLVVSTGTGYISVPSVAGMDVSNATSALEDAGFVVRTTEVTSDYEAGVVVAQDLTEAAPGSTITLTVSTGPATEPTTSTPEQTITPIQGGEEEEAPAVSNAPSPESAQNTAGA